MNDIKIYLKYTAYNSKENPALIHQMLSLNWIFLYYSVELEVLFTFEILKNYIKSYLRKSTTKINTGY